MAPQSSSHLIDVYGSPGSSESISKDVIYTRFLNHRVAATAKLIAHSESDVGAGT